MTKILIALCVILQLTLPNFSYAQEARNLIKEVVTANGGINALKALNDVSYEYTFRNNNKNVVDISSERYIFEGEISYAHYHKREYLVLPKLKGTYTQFFNGANTVSILNDTIITDEKTARLGHFFRKTNFYWFSMMFKLLDPGVNHKMMPDRKLNGLNYKMVEMTFDENIGEVSDRYILYINPKTKRIDQFLFTVLSFGTTTPHLMKIKYEKINGIYLSTYRTYAPADWEGNVLVKRKWNEQFSKNIKFNNGFNSNNIQN